jgi:flagellar hook-associated protein 2
MADVSTISQSAIDANVAQYKTTLQKPLTNLQNQRTTDTTRLNALSDLKTKLDLLMGTLRSFTLPGTASGLLGYSVANSMPSVVTATASSSASVGSHSLLVTQLGQTDMALSSSLADTSTSIADAEGAGTKTIQIAINGTTKNVDVDIAAGDTNGAVLSKLANAISASGAGVSAAVVSVNSTDKRLVINGKTTGAQGAISLSNVSGTLLDNIGLGSSVVSGRTAATSTLGGYTHSDTALLNAVFKFDGIDFVRDSNTISNVIPGLSLQLTGVQKPTDSPLSLSVGLDQQNIQSSIQTFIKQYNDVLTAVVSKTAVDPASHVRQIFAGDTSFLSLRRQLRTIASGIVSSVTTGNPATLSQVGIAIGSDGTLSLTDSAKLNTAAGADGAQLSDLFNSTNGIATQLKQLVDSFTKGSGLIQKSKDGISSQMSSLDTRIKRVSAGIDAKVARYRDEIGRLQATYSMLTQQSQMIQSIVNSTYLMGQ